MIWRKTNPLARQLLQVAEVVRQAAEEMRTRQDQMALSAAVAGAEARPKAGVVGRG
jgi:LysR family hydrogen peroxide-inducible transcriptional activator